MHFERYVWITALVRYFAVDAKTPAGAAAVLGALGVTQEDWTRAVDEFERPLVRGLVRGELDLAHRQAKELELARREILERAPTLDDVRARAALETSGERIADETAMMPLYLPDVILPFGGERRSETPAPAPRLSPARDAQDLEMTIDTPLSTLAPATPFTADVSEETVLQPSPFAKPRTP